MGESTEEKAYFVPLYMRHSSENAYDVSLFPFFWGKTAERSYGGIFPFYGKLYHRFRRDEIGFALWPLYGYSASEGTTRTNILWPLFSFYKGREEGFKLGPLYGRRRIGDERRSSFVLWPFFIKDEKDLNADNPKASLCIFPFYMQTTSPQSSFYAVMWPFFTYMRVQDRTEVKAPWPFFSYATGKEENEFHLWPVYSHSKVGKDEVTYVLWPIYKGSERYPGDKKWTQKRVLIIDKYETDDRGTFFNICPFFEYRREQRGDSLLFPLDPAVEERGVRQDYKAPHYLLRIPEEGRQDDDELPLRFLYEGAGGSALEKAAGLPSGGRKGDWRHGFPGPFGALRAGQRQGENLLYTHK